MPFEQDFTDVNHWGGTSFDFAFSSFLDSLEYRRPSSRAKPSPNLPIIERTTFVVPSSSGSVPEIQVTTGDAPNAISNQAGGGSDRQMTLPDRVTRLAEGERRQGIPMSSGTVGHPQINQHHAWTQQGNVTPTTAIIPLVKAILEDEKKVFLCDWTGCARNAPFRTKGATINHVRSVHLEEKPFICTCGKSFGRMHDADRHAHSKNRGKIYGCRRCPGAFSRKDYLSVHEARCSK